MKNLVIALTVAAMSLVAVETTAVAGGPNTQYIDPGQQVAPVNPPQLGFTGQMSWNGFHIHNVLWGTPAKQMGLESGDTIIRVNGIYIKSVAQYRYALGRYNGSVNLLVRDVRTGNLVNVNGYVPMNNGPVVYGAAKPASHNHGH